MNDLSVSILLKNDLSMTVTPYTNMAKAVEELIKKGIKNAGDPKDPDDCIICKEIYKRVFPFYNEEKCRGETLNTYNSTFGRNFNYISKKEKPTTELLKKIDNFYQIFLTIGNFTILERGRNSINCRRGSCFGSIRDSWPLTLLCIQDYLSGFSKLTKNPLENSFKNNKATISFFERYLKDKNGFELFCNEQYFKPQLYNNKFGSYIDENYNVKLDLFDKLSFSKPLPENLKEIEQYIECSTDKIIERGKIIINEYLIKNNN